MNSSAPKRLALLRLEIRVQAYCQAELCLLFKRGRPSRWSIILRPLLSSLGLSPIRTLIVDGSKKRGEAAPDNYYNNPISQIIKETPLSEILNEHEKDEYTLKNWVKLAPRGRLLAESDKCHKSRRSRHAPLLCDTYLVFTYQMVSEGYNAPSSIPFHRLSNELVCGEFT